MLTFKIIRLICNYWIQNLQTIKTPLLGEFLVNHSPQKVFKSLYHQTEFIFGKMFAKSIEKCQITLYKRGSSTNIRLPQYLYKYLVEQKIKVCKEIYENKCGSNCVT